MLDAALITLPLLAGAAILAFRKAHRKPPPPPSPEEAARLAIARAEADAMEAKLMERRRAQG